MRKNPEVERLERENALLRKQIARYHEDPGDIPFVACDNSCVVAQATGMATNGGCICDEVILRRAVGWWRRVAQFRAEVIREMRGDAWFLDAPQPGEREIEPFVATETHPGTWCERCERPLPSRKDDDTGAMWCEDCHDEVRDERVAAAREEAKYARDDD